MPADVLEMRSPEIPPNNPTAMGMAKFRITEATRY